MKKINFKKVLASVAALSVVACVAAVPASAADGTFKVTIDQKTVTMDEAKSPFRSM